MKNELYIIVIAILLAAGSSFAQQPSATITQPADTSRQKSPEADSKTGKKDTSVIVQKDSLIIAGSKDTLFIKETRGESLGEKAKDAAEDLSPPPLHEIISFTKVFWSIIFLLVGGFVIRIFTRSMEKIAEKSAKYRITIKGFTPVVRIFGWIVILYIIIAGIFQPPAATLIAVSASLGLAVGFAAQDILKNIFGGLMILFDRPFLVGDKIDVGGHYGEVIKIGLRSTRIVTADDSVVSIPNGEIMNSSVSNTNSGEPNCQVVAEVYLPISVDVSAVRKIAIEAAQTSKYIYLKKPIAVLFFNEIKERKPYLKMRLKAYVMDIRYEFAFKSEMTETTIRELIENDILSEEAFQA